MTLQEFIELAPSVLPELLLILLAFVLLVVDLRGTNEDRDTLAWLTFWGLVVTFVATLVYSTPTGEEVWGGMLRHDYLAFVFRLIFLFGAAATVLFSMNWESIGKRGEFYLLLVISTMGMNLMGASADIIMLFLAIETASIPLYVMAGFMTDDDKSAESGFKYLLFGAMTSAIMLYGFTLLYGFSGTTNIYEIASGIIAGDVPTVTVMASTILVLVGFGFKISMAPFHFWAPDVYEGAPTPVTGFLSTASKAAGFAVVLRVLLEVYPDGNWIGYIAVLSAVTMTLGNLVALRQTNIKRLLAYSSIAHAGYILMGVAAASELGVTSAIYYIVVYLLSNLAAFGFVIIYYKDTGSDEIADYAGMSRRSPGLAFGMLLIFLSLGGIPPLGGFFAKVLVFAAAVESGLVWLAIVGVINAVIGLYYYLIVLKVVYLYRAEGDDAPLPVPRPQALLMTVLVIGVVLLGTWLAPMYEWSINAASIFSF